MKWAVMLLCLLGVLAAMCAAFLVNGMRLPAIATRVIAPTTRPDTVIEVQMLTATRAIPAMTVVDSRMVAVKSVLKSQAPAEYITSTSDVVGRVLAVRFDEGQAFTPASFADSTPAKLVAEAIPHGKRAVGISVTDYSGLEGMLYPGSTVDVIASFKADSADQREAMTRTILENVQVLGIEHETIVSANKPRISGDHIANVNPGNSRRVALLVDTKQAKILRAAQENGTLSLAMRNPMDAGKANTSTVSTRELMGEEPTAIESGGDALGKYIVEMLKAAAARKESAAAPEPPSTLFGTDNRVPQWEVEIIRGKDIETRSFDLPPTQNAEADAKVELKKGL